MDAGFWVYMTISEIMIVKGFESAGITEAITQELLNEDPFADLD